MISDEIKNRENWLAVVTVMGVMAAAEWLLVFFGG